MTETDIARLTRERDEARERAASLSRELLDAMHARDDARDLYHETEERRCAEMTRTEAAESRAERLEAALRGLLYCLNAGYPCTAEMDIARAALREEGK